MSQQDSNLPEVRSLAHKGNYGLVVGCQDLNYSRFNKVHLRGHLTTLDYVAIFQRQLWCERLGEPENEVRLSELEEIDFLDQPTVHEE